MKRFAWWWLKQGLDGSLMGADPATLLSRTGWARSVGGAAPYLTLFARAGTTRAAADAAVANLEIHELPAARGCTYVVPAADFGLALKLAQPFSEVPITAAKKHLGVTAAELDSLCQAVTDALASGKALTPDQLKEACGGAVRSLGEAGKKRGASTTLPMALGYLQAQGEVRRVPINGRLDQQRYAYTRWVENPLKGFTLTETEAATELARRFFQWIGPATLKEFQEFAGLGVAATKAAVAPLGLVPVAGGAPQLLLPEERERYEAYIPPDQPSLSLVSSLDSLALLRRDLGALLDEADRERPIYTERGATTGGSLADATCHLIIDRGQVIGLWEYDPTTSEIAWMSFGAAPAGLREVIDRTERFAREELGDVRSFSLDSPASRAPKIAWLREQSSLLR